MVSPGGEKLQMLEKRMSNVIRTSSFLSSLLYFMCPFTLPSPIRSSRNLEDAPIVLSSFGSMCCTFAPSALI
jgi:hypothetical protein